MLDDIEPPNHSDDYDHYNHNNLNNDHNMNEDMMDDDMIDQRSIRSEAKTMLYRSEAVDKSIKKTHRIKAITQVPVKQVKLQKSQSLVMHSSSFTSNPRLATSQSTLSFKKGSNSIGSLEEDSSIITQSISNSLDPISKYEGISFPLLHCERFLASCWRAFYENCSEPVPINQFDQCELALSVELIPAAIAVLSRKVTLEEIDEYCQQFQFVPNSCLTWSQFKDFCAFIFTPILQSALVNAGLPLRSNNTKTSSSLEQENGSLDQERWPTLRQESHPYTQMIRKHRFKSCIDIEELDMPLAEESVRSVELPVGKYSAHSDIAGVKVPMGMLHDALLARTRKICRQERAARLLSAEDGKASRADSDAPDGTLPAIDRKTPSRVSKSPAMSNGSDHPIEKLPRYCQPLSKQKVYELMNQEQSYASKWSKMKENRDARFSRQANRVAQNAMMHAFKKTVISSDRMTMEAAHSATSLAIQQEREAMHWRNKHNEDMSSWRRSVYLKQERMRKEVQARDLRRAIGVAVGKVEDEKERDRMEKSYFKPDSSIAKLSGDTSYHVDMPSEILDRIKNAKRYSEFTAAKKQAELYYERTISERIARYTQARSMAVARATASGGPVTINTMFGDMLFSPKSPAPLAGVAATMSLAYSSAQSSDVLGGSSLSPPGSPSFFNLSESNNFLKELAEKEYLARKQSYVEFDENEMPSDDISDTEASWRTDPRVAHLH